MIFIISAFQNITYVTIYIVCWSSTLVFLPGFRQFLIKKLRAMKGKVFPNNNIKNINLAQNTQNISKRIFYPYKPLIVEIIFVLFRFLGFLFCMKSFSIGSLVSLGELISSFSLAWITGLIVPAAPGGLGVFESVILLSLGSHFSEAPLLASLLCYRFISTASDIMAAFIYPVRKLFKV